MTDQVHGFAALDAQTRKPIALAMQRLWLTGELTPAGARLSVKHEFRSEEKAPLEVIYAFPLPRDAAIHKFRIAGEGFEAHSELKPVEEATKSYEAGIAAGSLAALAQQYGDGIVNLTVGNVRPGERVAVDLELVAGVELNDEGFRFRFPFTLAPRYHSRARCFRRPGGEGEIELPADEFGSVILPPMREDASGLHEVDFDLVLCGVSATDDIGSPSHPIRMGREAAGRRHVALAIASDLPDRDLVLDCGTHDSAPRVMAASVPGGKSRFAAVLPSVCFGQAGRAPRRVVFLLDRSGSMQGSAIEQARKAIEACLAILSESDAFGIVAFDNESEVLDKHLLPGTRENRRRAADFLQEVNARGGTELMQGMEAACRMIGSADADIVVLTDGQVAGTEQVLARARETGARLHTLGIGSAAQDRFLAQLARETGGASRCVNPEERVDMAAVNLFASVGQPVATGLKANVVTRPDIPLTVTAGAPVELFGETEERSLTLEWDGGSLVVDIEPGNDASAGTLRLMQGARLIADWESRYPAVDALAPLEKRQQNRVAMQLRQLSEEYGLASREMSLVAVVTRAGDRAGELPVTRVVPVGLPRGVQMGAYFDALASFGHASSVLASAGQRRSSLFFLEVSPSPPGASIRFAGLKSVQRQLKGKASAADRLVELATRLEPDGGMPGKNAAERYGYSAVALLAFVSHGHSGKSGAFRLHVRRLVEFLGDAKGLSKTQEQLIRAVLEAAKQGKAEGHDWLSLAIAGAETAWTELAAAFEHA